MGNIEIAKKCIDLAEFEILKVNNRGYENIHYAIMTTAVDLAKTHFDSTKPEKPNIKDKYLYVLEFTNKTIKIGITKEKNKRLKAISSAMSLSQSTKTNTKNAIGKKQVFAKLITLMQSHVLVMDTKSLMWKQFAAEAEALRSRYVGAPEEHFVGKLILAVTNEVENVSKTLE